MDYNFENSDFKKIIILKNFVFVILYVVIWLLFIIYNVVYW